MLVIIATFVSFRAIVGIDRDGAFPNMGHFAPQPTSEMKRTCTTRRFGYFYAELHWVEMMMRFGSLVLAASAILLPAAAVAAPVTGKISFSGYDQAVGSTSVVNATGLDFANSSGSAVVGTSGTLNGYAAGQGSFAALDACGSITPGCGTIQDIADFNTSSPISGFLSLLTGGPGVSFDLTSITKINRVTSTGALFLTGTGVINFSGYDATPGRSP